LIESIRMKNFRRFKDETVQFQPSLNLIEGINNSGKSTILYAVEYSFFGTVKGFNRKSDITNYNANHAGVELRFTCLDVIKYRLLRFHKLGRGLKVADSHFTLKKIIEDKEGTKEEYVLSSDLNDIEEDLALKIREITGLSRRLFDITIGARQGSIPNIIKGSDSLDIVLGVTAADILTRTFRERKRFMMSVVAQKPTFEALLERLKSEKMNINKEKTGAEEELKKLIKEKKDLEKDAKEITIISELIERIAQLQNSMRNEENQIKVSGTMLKEIVKELEEKGFKEDLEPWKTAILKIKKQLEKNQKNKEKNRALSDKTTAEAAETRQKLGQYEGQILSSLDTLNISREELKEKVKGIKTKAVITSELTKVKIKKDETEKQYQEILYSKGDLEGRLSRRKDSSKKPVCETCGAEIDANRAKNEIASLSKDLTALTSKEKKLNELLEKDLEKIQQLENHLILSSAANVVKNIITTEKQLTTLEIKYKEIVELNDELVTQESEFQREKDTKEREVSELEKLIERKKKLQTDIKAIEKNVEKTILEIDKKFAVFKKEIDSKKQKSELSKKIAVTLDTIDLTQREQLSEHTLSYKDLIFERQTEVRVLLDNKVQQEREKSERFSNLQKRTMTVDADISRTESELSTIEVKERFANRYEILSNAFKEVQTKIRENASKSLSVNSFKLLNHILKDSEIERLSISSDDYSMHVLVKGWDRMVPASVYQGGGMQLMLGLSYRFAIGNFVQGLPFLFADEPTYGADSDNRRKILSSFKKLKISPQTFLVTHQSDAIDFEPPNRVMVIQDGSYSKIDYKESQEAKAEVKS